MDHTMQFVRLSRISIIFLDVPVSLNLRKNSRTFENFPGDMGTLYIVN